MQLNREEIRLRLSQDDQCVPDEVHEEHPPRTRSYKLRNVTLVFSVKQKNYKNCKILS